MKREHIIWFDKPVPGISRSLSRMLTEIPDAPPKYVMHVRSVEDVGRDMGLDSGTLNALHGIVREALSSPIEGVNPHLIALHRFGIDRNIPHTSTNIIRMQVDELVRNKIEGRSLEKAQKPTFVLSKGGPFIGPRGGKWQDAKMTIPWNKEGGGGRLYPEGAQRKRIFAAMENLMGVLNKGDMLNKAFQLQKAQPKGGKYVARVEKEGKRRYYYDEKKYKATHGDHVNGESALSETVRSSVMGTVEKTSPCDVKAFKALVGKYGADKVHSAVKACVDGGDLIFEGGMFKTKAKAKDKKKDVKKSQEPIKDPKGGLTARGRKHFEEKEGGDLKPGVKGAADTSEKMRRKGSFLRRHYAKTPQPPFVDDKGKPTRHALQANAWGESIPKTAEDARKLAAKGERLLARYSAVKKAFVLSKAGPFLAALEKSNELADQEAANG